MRTGKELDLAIVKRSRRRRRLGRKLKGPRPLMAYKARPRFDKPSAVHVTLRVAIRVCNQRTRRRFRLVEHALAAARDRFGLRVIDFVLLGNHMHLVVEADDDEALSRGMQGVSTRLAKAIKVPGWVPAWCFPGA